MAAKQIVVLGGGFAGLWSAVGAARKLDELGLGAEAVQITLVNRTSFHSIRVRNYEADLSATLVPLEQVLGPIGVRQVQADVVGIDAAARTVALASGGSTDTLSYDRLVFALGSELVRPALPGLREHAFDIDTYAGAAKLNAHLAALPVLDETPGRFTVVVVGAGLTGIEAACEMPGKLRAALAAAGEERPIRVVLADHNSHIGSDMGTVAETVIQTALDALRVETRVNVRVAAIAPTHVLLESGDKIDTSTVVWCAGMRANPLARHLGVATDRWGRVPVDEFLGVENAAGVFAAGDVAALNIDGRHASVMSCQHARPMGRFAGHNVVCDLLGLPMLSLQIDWYVTVLDLGPWGAVYTEGWDRQVVAQGEIAKRTKQTINCERIYPPLTGNRAEILAAAAPVVQSPPKTYHRSGDAS